MKGVRCVFVLFILGSFILAYQTEKKEEPSKSLVIVGARLINGTGSPPVDEAVIVITEGKFSEVGLKGDVAIPETAEIMNVEGKTVIPGLIDGHFHISSFAPSKYDTSLSNDSINSYRAAYRLKQMLMVGVTTVRDVGSPSNVSIMAKKAFEEGLLKGSRPIVVGQAISCTGGHGSTNAWIADGVAEWRKGVRYQLQAGADLIKLMPSYSKEEIWAAIEETHAHERFATVHSGMFKEQYDFIRWAIEAGADCVEHAYALPDDVIQLMADKDVYCCPTVSVLLLIAENYSKRFPKNPPRKKHLESVEIFRKLREAGVKMGVGTDAVRDNTLEYPDFYFDEIEWFVDHGYTPMQVIVAATKINAEICDAVDKLGTIEKDKLADLLVIDGDPLKDIKALRNNLAVIIQGGKVIEP
jgi:imidazolonepropionase-like amidohydrolase